MKFPPWAVSALLVANLTAVLLAFALVWIPEVRAYWVGFPKVDAVAVAAARTEPSAGVLDEVATQFVGVTLLYSDGKSPSPQNFDEFGRRVLAGELPSAGPLPEPLHFPFRASSLDVGLPTQQLVIAMMGTTRDLLQAYHATGNERYLHSALTDALAFAEVDRWRLVPRALLWNDHALAARLAVLADLWSQVRHRPDLGERRAHQLLVLAQQTADRLAKPNLFIYRTNHGVMQSLALLQFAVAFPTLEGAKEARALGCSRLVEQLPYYIDFDGVTLEHSPGYHDLGRRLLTLAIRLFEMNTCPVPFDWPEKLSRATDFSRLLFRPDRSLPGVGNTDHAPVPVERSVDVATAPRTEFAVFQSAGFAVWWRGLSTWPDPTSLAQTVVTWSHFPSRAHKLADDMSVVVWAAGRPWLTNSGYWPYGIEGYKQANGWRGSNAPHFAGEPPRSERTATLRGFGNGFRLAVVDVERRVAGHGKSLRRQIVELDGATWVIVDSADGTFESTVDRIWTTMPETKVHQVSGREYLLTATDVQAVARLSFLGDLAYTPTARIGELDAFAGWIVRARRHTPAPSFEVRQKQGQMVVTVLSVGAASAGVPTLEPTDAGPDNWRIALDDSVSQRSVQRSGNRVVVRDASGTAEVELSAPAPDALERRQSIIASYEAAARAYSTHRDLTHYRYGISWLMLALLVVQELGVFLTRRWSVPAANVLRVVAMLSWLVFGLFTYYSYLR